MRNVFASKIAYFILTFLFLIITASFLFSNFDSFSGGTGSGQNVAAVDGTPITAKEFNMALTRQIEFFNQMMGGNGMTQAQLEQMGIKQSVLSGLVQQKLILNASKDMGFRVSLDEVKNEIRNMPYFKTKDQFDVNLYRNALQANGYIPTQFEELVNNDLKQKKMEELFTTVLVSDNFVQDVLKFKNNAVTIQGVKISRQALSPLVSVSEQEIKDYLAKPENQKNIETAYTDNMSKYNKAEEVKARHILIQGDDAKTQEKIKAIRSKVTTKNFGDIAKKETEDPTGKGNGGDLGWFSAGRMVPEFEAVAFKMKAGEISQPVKTQFGYHIIYVEDKKSAESKSMDSVKPELARLALQKTKGQDLEKLLKEQEAKFSELLKSGNIAAIESEAKKVDGQVFKNTDINEFDQNISGNNLAPGEAEQIFKAPAGTLVNLGNPGTIYLVKIVSKREGTGAVTPEQKKAESGAQAQNFTRKVREELLKVLNNKAKVVTNAGLM